MGSLCKEFEIRARPDTLLIAPKELRKASGTPLSSQQDPETLRAGWS